MVTVVLAWIRNGRVPGIRSPFQSTELPLPSITRLTPGVLLSDGRRAGNRREAAGDGDGVGTGDGLAVEAVNRRIQLTQPGNGPGVIATPRALKGADVSGRTLRPGDAALVGGQAGIAGVDGRAVQFQGVSLGRTAVVRQRQKERRPSQGCCSHRRRSHRGAIGCLLGPGCSPDR